MSVQRFLLHVAIDLAAATMLALVAIFTAFGVLAIVTEFVLLVCRTLGWCT